MKRNVSVIVAVIALVAAGGIYLFLADRTPFSERPPAVGARAPKIELADVDGQVVSLARYQGVPVIVYFWANWCPPCKDELGVLQNVYDQLGGDGIGVVGLAIDDVPPGLAGEKGISFPLLGVNERVRTDWGNVNDVPATFILDQNGIIVRKTRDYLNAAQIKEILVPLLAP